MNHESGDEEAEVEDLDDGAPADVKQDEQKPGDATKKGARNGMPPSPPQNFEVTAPKSK